MDFETQPNPSILSQSLASMDHQEPKKNANPQYDALKMKYFHSLGMNRPPAQLSSSVPTTSYMNNTPSSTMSIPKQIIRQRTKTAPSPKSDSEDSDARKRTTSVPIPISGLPATGVPHVMSVSVGTYLTTSFDDEEDDEETETNKSLNISTNSIKFDAEDEKDIFDEDENLNFGIQSSFVPDRLTDSPLKFVPPHEMLANNKSQFNVGTAHSVAIWEQRRRKFI